jgi:hypothetical protein
MDVPGWCLVLLKDGPVSSQAGSTELMDELTDGSKDSQELTVAWKDGSRAAKEWTDEWMEWTDESKVSSMGWKAGLRLTADRYSVGKDG